MRRTARLARRRSPRSPSRAAPAPKTHRRQSGPAYNYVCPNVDGKPALDCYLDAVAHLYTMCRHVKSIEIIEFGYDEVAAKASTAPRASPASTSRSGNITRPYQAALREADAHRSEAVEGLRSAATRPGLKALADLTVAPGRDRRRLQERVHATPYDDVRRSASTACASRRHGARARRPPATEAAAREAEGRRASDRTPGRALTTARRARRPPTLSRADAERRRAAARSSATAARSRAALPGFRVRAAAARDGRRRSRTRSPRGPAGRRGRHRHRQDVRLPRARAALRRQGDRLDRHQDAAGPALRARPAAGARRAALARRRSRCSRAAPTTSAIIISSARRARAGCRRATTRGTCRRSSRSRAPSERGDRARARRRSRERVDLAARHVDARELPRHRTARIYRDCFVMKARKEALEADVVVVNHHLFFADVMLRDEGVAELLPACNTVILDEAHQLPDTATLFFGEQTTAGQLARARARRRGRRAHGGSRRAATCPTPRRRSRRRSASCASPRAKLPGKLPRDVALAARGLRRRARRARRGARPRSRPSSAQFAERSEDLAQCAASRRRRARAGSRAGATPRTRPTTTGRGWIRWVDVTPHGFQLHASPLSVRRTCSAARSTRPRARVDLHVGDARGRPRLLATTRASSASTTPRPAAGRARSTTRAGAALRAARPARSRTRPSTPMPSSTPRCRCSQASGGRAFLLFTTLRALAQRARAPGRRASRATASTFRCWCRAKARAPSCSSASAALGNAVLLGSASFWEGVDVPGDALSVVVIDKLPFAPPDDPLLAARLEQLARRRRQSVLATGSCRRRRSASSRARAG